jgi:hypothetical protein
VVVYFHGGGWVLGDLDSAQGIVQGIGVPGQGAGLVAAVGGYAGRGVAAGEGRNRPEPGCGQPRQQVPVGVRGVGKAMQAQGQGAIVRPGRQAAEIQAACLDPEQIRVHGITCRAPDRLVVSPQGRDCAFPSSLSCRACTGPGYQ